MPAIVDVWYLSFAAATSYRPHFEQLLSPDETQRAASYRFETHRERYISGRGVLRLLLSQYTGQTPAQIRFEYNAFGKPHLPGHNLHFNLAHTDVEALYAFSRQVPLGIDIERIHPLPDWVAVAETVFTERERASLHRAAPADQLRLFYTYWTCKEAFMKATGSGMQIHPRSIELTQGNAPPRFTSLPTGTVQEWRLAPVELDLPVVAHLALEGPVPTVRTHTLTPTSMEAWL